jgi:hypothetical protein
MPDPGEQLGGKGSGLPRRPAPAEPADADASSGEAGAKPGVPGRSSDSGAKTGRSLTWFYAIMVVVIALGLLGVWFWKTWTVWWFDANSGSTTHPVGKKQPNAWGLHDMHGNVWEWCGDWYDEYPKGWKPQTDPTGPATGSSRVLRGGSWYYGPSHCRSARRYGSGPAFRHDYVGFRVGVVPAGP